MEDHMTVEELLEKKTFVVAGDTVNEEKYAFKIKKALLDAGYSVHAVGKELGSIDDVPGTFDVLDLCIHPVKGLALLEGCTKDIPGVIIQPGAGSEEIRELLDRKGIPYVDGCVLKGLENINKL